MLSPWVDGAERSEATAAAPNDKLYWLT